MPDALPLESCVTVFARVAMPLQVANQLDAPGIAVSTGDLAIFFLEHSRRHLVIDAVFPMAGRALNVDLPVCREPVRDLRRPVVPRKLPTQWPEHARAPLSVRYPSSRTWGTSVATSPRSSRRVASHQLHERRTSHICRRTLCHRTCSALGTEARDDGKPGIVHPSSYPPGKSQPTYRVGELSDLPTVEILADCARQATTANCSLQSRGRPGQHRLLS